MVISTRLPVEKNWQWELNGTILPKLLDFEKLFEKYLNFWDKPKFPLAIIF